MGFEQTRQKRGANGLLDSILDAGSAFGIKEEDEGERMEDDDECDDENELEDEEVKAILLADAILNGPPPDGEKIN